MKQKIKTNRGEASFGLIIILFLIALFFLWYFTGGPARQNDETPFLKVQTPST
jgi:hypothetical protein